MSPWLPVGSIMERLWRRASARFARRVWMNLAHKKGWLRGLILIRPTFHLLTSSLAETALPLTCGALVDNLLMTK